MEPSRFQRIVEYLLDNLFDMVTILVAGFLVVRHQITPFSNNDIPELASWILAVLGLIAVSGLWDRNRRLQRIENLSEENRDLINRRLGEKAPASDFFFPEKRLPDQKLLSADSIYLSGMTLSRTIKDYKPLLLSRLMAGAAIKIIILEPTRPLMKELTLRSSGNTNTDSWRNKIQTAEGYINDLINESPGRKGKIEIGYLPYIPSFGFTLINPDSPYGICLVELYHHKSSEKNPTFELIKSKDPIWFDFFKDQFEILWNSCRIETLPKSPKPAIENPD